MKAISVTENGLTFWWASIDGENYLPINRKPEPDDAPAVEDLFQYKEEIMADGTVVWKGHVMTARIGLLRLQSVPGIEIHEHEIN